MNCDFLWTSDRNGEQRRLETCGNFLGRYPIRISVLRAWCWKTISSAKDISEYELWLIGDQQQQQHQQRWLKSPLPFFWKTIWVAVLEYLDPSAKQRRFKSFSPVCFLISADLSCTTSSTQLRFRRNGIIDWRFRGVLQALLTGLFGRFSLPVLDTPPIWYGETLEDAKAPPSPQLFSGSPSWRWI